MSSSRRLKRGSYRLLLLMVLFLITALVPTIVAQANPGFCLPGGAGLCLFALIGTCEVEDAICVLNINLSIPDGSFVRLSNTILMFNGTFNGSLGINASGTLSIGNSSNITNGNHSLAGGNDAHYFFWVEQTATFNMQDSVIEKTGWQNNPYKRGLEIRSKMLAFRNNTIQQSFYGMVLQESSNNTIENSTIKDIRSSPVTTYGVLINNSHNNSFVNVVLRDFDDPGTTAERAMLVWASENTSIRNSTFVHMKGGGILLLYSNKTTIENNRIINFSSGITFGTDSFFNNVTNNTIAEALLASGATSLSIANTGNRVIGNAIYNISNQSTFPYILASLIHVADPAVIADNQIFQNSYKGSIIKVTKDGGVNITNNTFRDNTRGTGIEDSVGGAATTSNRYENNSFINNTVLGISVQWNLTRVQNNTFINHSGVGILAGTATGGTTNTRYNLTIRENVFQYHGEDSNDYPIQIIRVKNSTIERNTMFVTTADYDLFLDTGATMNVTLNHFLSKGVGGSGASSSSFCNNVDSLQEGNFYNESITPENMGPGDCGMVNITSVEESCPPRYIGVFWRRQSAFLPVTYDLYAVNNLTLEETLVATTDKLRAWIDGNILSAGNYTFKLVPFITQFERHNGTNNKTSEGIEICFNSDCEKPHVVPRINDTWKQNLATWINATVTDNRAVDNVSANVTDPNNNLITMKLLPPIKPLKDHMVEYDYRNGSFTTIGSGINDFEINEWLNISGPIKVNQGGIPEFIVANFTLNASCIPRFNFSWAFFSWDDRGDAESNNWDDLILNLSIFNHTNREYQMIGTNFSEFRLGGVGSRCNVVKLGVEIHPDFLENSIINFSLHIDITDNNPTGEAYPGPNATICDDESVDVEPLAIRAKFIWSRIQPGHIYRGLYNDTGTLGIYNVKYFANDTSNNINDLVSTSFEVLP